MTMLETTGMIKNGSFWIPNILRPNEPAWSLEELNLTPPDYGAKRRYQIIKVVRGDALHEHHTDMGLVSEFGTTKQLNIIGGTVDEQGRGHVWETVASLLDYADNLRYKEYDWDDIPAMSADDYTAAYVDEQDKQQRSRSGRTISGSLPKDKR